MTDTTPRIVPTEDMPKPIRYATGGHIPKVAHASDPLPKPTKPTDPRDHAATAADLLERQDHAIALSMNLVDREMYRTARAQAHAALAIADALERLIIAVRQPATEDRTWGLDLPGDDLMDLANATATGTSTGPDPQVVKVPVLDIPMRDDLRDLRTNQGGDQP